MGMARVALVRSDNRRGAVAQALDLIREDIRAVIVDDVLLKPNLVSHRRQVASTHADALSATLDALFSAGAGHVTIAEGATDAPAGFDAFGHRREAAGRPIRFLDLNREETGWEPLILSAIDGSPLEARISRTIASSPCRVSLALMKTHVISTATMSLKNMLSSVHPADRVRMHGYPGGNGSTGWKRLVVEILKGDNILVNILTRTQGRVRNLLNAITGKSCDASRLSKADLAFLRSVAALNRNLVTLTRLVKPHVSVLDGFVAMHREGPRHGTPIRLGLALAGTDAVAVDAVAAAAMGFDPMQIGHLRLAHEAGLGTADLARIEVVGDPLALVARRCTPHSNFAVHRHWERFAAPARSAIRGPISMIARDREATPR
jgi:uncharacterized protein (DUF362 family)